MVSRPLLYAPRVDVDHLLAGLDEAQHRAVTTPTQPLCILAGAGSGKTRVLTRRIAYRAAKADLDPRRVLALTFTRRAAAELTNRLRTFGLRDLPAAGTFHATAYAALHDHWMTTDRRPPTLLERKGRILGRLLGGSRRFGPADLGSEIEWAKARLVTPAEYPTAARRAGRVTALSGDKVADLYARYEEEKRTRHLVDFDDLLVHCATALEDDPSFAAAQRWRYRHVFVDEYQDVNPLQERLLRAWLGGRPDVCVVGDPNQAIYRWNGADASFLLQFAREHAGAETIELVDSYRSTPEVLAVAASVLAGDGGRPRPLRAHRESGPVPQVRTYATDAAEADGIARAVRDGRGPDVPWSGQAVLVRTNAQTVLIEAALRRARIPYRVRGGDAFLDDVDVRNLLRDLASSRTPFSTTLADLEISLLPLDDGGDDDAGTRDRHVPNPDSAAARRRAAVEEVVRLGRDFVILDRHAPTSAFPAWLAANIRSEDPQRAGDAVTLATFHAAKGLEWPVVHLAGMEDGFAPITHAREPEALTEERRLVYVAITRAQRRLRLSWAESRTFGAMSVARRPSPYLRQVMAATTTMATSHEPVHTSGVFDHLTDTRAVLAPATASPDGRASKAAVLTALQGWRAQTARAAGVAPSVVLPDRTLVAVAIRRPSNPGALATVPGLGPLKAARYGDTLLALVAAGGRDADRAEA